MAFALSLSFFFFFLSLSLFLPCSLFAMCLYSFRYQIDSVPVPYNNIIGS